MSPISPRTSAAAARLAVAATSILALGLFAVGVRGATFDDTIGTDVPDAARAATVAADVAPGAPSAPLEGEPAGDGASTSTDESSASDPGPLGGPASTTPPADAVAPTTPPVAPTSTAPPPTTLSTPRVSPAAGRYPVSITGSAALNGSAQDVPDRGELVIESLSGSDQRQRTPGPGGDAVAVLRYAAGTASLVSLELRAGGVTKTLEPDPPARYLSFGSPAGTTWSWRATTTDGRTNVDATGRAGAVDTVTVGATAVPVDVVETTLTLSGDVSGTVRLTTWVARDSRLPVRQHQVIDVRMRSIVPLHYTADSTTALTSLTAS